MTISDTNKQKYLDSIIFGGTRSLCVNVLLYPLDVIKTHQQADKNCEKSNQVVKRIWNQNGPIGFYKGLSSQLLKSTLRQTWTWPMVVGIPHYLALHNIPQLPQFLITALLIATVDAAVTTPLEKRRILSITDNKKTPLNELVQQGRKGWSGFKAHQAKLSVRWATFLNAQAYFREKARKQSNSEKLSYVQLTIAGTKVAFFVSLACAPFDVANTIKQSTGKSIWQNLYLNRQSLAIDAISAIRKGFRGWPLSATSMIVHNVASVILMERLGIRLNMSR